jgi:hypothetical protein
MKAIGSAPVCRLFAARNPQTRMATRKRPFLHAVAAVQVAGCRPGVVPVRLRRRRLAGEPIKLGPNAPVLCVVCAAIVQRALDEERALPSSEALDDLAARSVEISEQLACRETWRG